jgi:hypothetical protein
VSAALTELADPKNRGDDNLREAKSGMKLAGRAGRGELMDAVGKLGGKKEGKKESILPCIHPDTGLI